MEWTAAAVGTTNERGRRIFLCDASDDVGVYPYRRRQVFRSRANLCAVVSHTPRNQVTKKARCAVVVRGRAGIISWSRVRSNQIASVLCRERGSVTKNIFVGRVDIDAVVQPSTHVPTLCVFFKKKVGWLLSPLGAPRKYLSFHRYFSLFVRTCFATSAAILWLL